jgi:hypothetical protein
VTWFVSGFVKGGGALTQEADLDEALGLLVGPLVGRTPSELRLHPVALSPAAVERINEILGVDLDTARADYILEFADPAAMRATED